MAVYDYSGQHELSCMLRDIMNKIESVSEDVKHLSYRMAQMEKTVDKLTKDRTDESGAFVTKSSMELDRVRGRITASVAYVNPMNIIFYGINQRHDMNSDSLFRTFLVQSLQVIHERAFGMSLHVQRLPRMSELDMTVPLCVTFKSHVDRRHVCEKIAKSRKYLERQVITAEGQYIRDNMYVQHLDSDESNQ